jgi:putative monooxygenase
MIVERVDHIGVVVDDLVRAREFLQAAFGLQVGVETEGDKLSTCRLSCGDIDIELVAVHEPVERERRLGAGVARIEHIAVEVASLENAATELAASGVRFTTSTPKVSPGSRSYWSEPGTSGGVQYQFVEARPAKADRPAVVVIDSAQRPTIARGGDVETTRMLDADLGSGRLTNGFTTLPPGTEIPMHFHNCEESVLVVDGVAAVEWPCGRDELDEGDVTFVPAGTPHRFTNPGTTPLRIFWTYASARPTRTVLLSGETVPIRDEGASAPG